MDHTPPPVPSSGSSISESADTANPFEGLQYPLTLSFKLIAVVNQVMVTDAMGRTVCYTRQKMFKLREHVEVWSDKSRSTLIADIKANKVLDWSARYAFTDARGGALGSVGRRGWRSIWKAHYDSFEPDQQQPTYSIQEESSWVKVMDSLFGQLPVLGFFAGYLFHPKYISSGPDQRPVMSLTKQPAFWEGKFKIEKQGDLSSAQEGQLILSFLMMVLLERERG